jgi:predicted DCC family thiol-disulfide oxidoreductase YuxK
MQTEKHIVLFDGECNFCSFWVSYVIKRDKKNVFRFASLKSVIGLELLAKYKVGKDVDSVILLENDKAYIKSTAALRILKILGGFKSIFYGLIIIPAFIRNFFYNIIATYRYRWFGKLDCEFVPHQNLKNKFLM